MAGQDYPHGTGHGVGCFLSVHEGPQRLSRASGQVLKPGMILSNEPGFYKENSFGIRIENLILVCEAAQLPNQTVPDMLNFQTLTWVPIDRRLIETDLLSSQERAWLNIYHQTCYQHVSAELSPAARQWMQAACAEI
jgi:Xaa-Pro aminopeptidase